MKNSFPNFLTWTLDTQASHFMIKESRICQMRTIRKYTNFNHEKTFFFHSKTFALGPINIMIVSWTSDILRSFTCLYLKSFHKIKVLCQNTDMYVDIYRYVSLRLVTVTYNHISYNTNSHRIHSYIAVPFWNVFDSIQRTNGATEVRYGENTPWDAF